MALLSSPGFSAATLPLIAVPLAVVGFYDDRKNLPASWRYCVQLLTAVLILCCSPLFQQFGFAVEYKSFLLLPSFLLLVIAVTAVINYTNFMDGLDGMVAGCMAVAIAALAIALALPWPIWALVGSLLGFCSGTGAPPKYSWVM